MKFRNFLKLPLLIALIVGLTACGGTVSKAPAPVTAEAAGVKAEKKPFEIVDVHFVKQYVKIPRPQGVMIVDSRPKRKRYDRGHIPTAVNIPDTKFAKYADRLPQDKDTLLIFYCQSPS